MLRCILFLLSVTAVWATSEPASKPLSDSQASSDAEGRSLRSGIQADPYFPGGYPGTGGYPGIYNRPSNCKNWCRRNNFYPGGYPGQGRVRYFCCDRSGPVVYPRPVPYPGPYPVGPGPFPGGVGPFPGGAGPFPGGAGPFPGGAGPFPGGPFTQTGNNYDRYTNVGPPAPPSNRYPGGTGAYDRYSSAYKVCPQPHPVCVTARNFASPPTECFGDAECAATDRCCPDTCLQHRVCKTADYISNRRGINRFNNRYSGGGLQYDAGSTTDFSDLVRHADSDILADDTPTVTSSGRVTSSDEPVTSAGESHKSSGSFKFE